MNDLELARTEINKIDEEMAHLFEQRMKICRIIADYKKAHGLSIHDPAREAALIQRSRSHIQDSDVESYYVRFLKKMMELSCQYQSKLINGMKIAYCGVEGAYAYIAAKKMFPDAELITCQDFSDAYHAVENGAYDCAVLPLENSYAGEVGTVMDLLFSGNLYINQVIDLPIRHNLLANRGSSTADIKKVISHSQALRQCSDYILRHGFETEDFSNTAAAAKHVRDSGDLSLAAIASEETAHIFDLDVLESGINDVQNNTTRFAAFSRVENKPAAITLREDENFILVFTVQNKAGALAQTLNIIGAHGFNMRNLRSRPMKDLQWNYFFYVEAEGNINNENGQDMLRELSAVCARLKLVGTFSSDARL